MPIKELSNRRRLPRAGTIRLGIKKKNDKTGKEYPSEVDYFVCPIEIQRIYGPEPKELPIMFPVEDESMFFPQFYNHYGKGVLLCRGDGEGENAGTFWDFEAGKFNKRTCPCERLESGKCKAVGRLQFLLPEIKGAVSVWQINTSSKNSIIDINSGIDVIRGFVGRVAMIPLLLKRTPIDTTKFEGDKVVKGRHYTMKLDLNVSLVEVQRIGQLPVTRAFLPPPDESQPEDLFPPNGHDPESKGEVIQGEKIEAKDKEISPVAQEVIDKKAEPQSEEKEKLDEVMGSDEDDDEEMLELEAKLQTTIEQYEEVTTAKVPKSQAASMKTKADFGKAIEYYQSRIDKAKEI